MSDDNSDSTTWRLVIGVGILFAFMLMYSLFDLFFLLLGSEGTATITETRISSSRRSGDYVIAYYKFKESDGFEREGNSNLGRNIERPPEGTEIKIQYLPRWFPAGKDGARPARPFNKLVLGLLGLTTLGLGFFTYRAIAAGSETPKKSSTRKRK